MISSYMRECGTVRVADGGKLVVVSCGNSKVTASWIILIFFLTDEIADLWHWCGSCSCSIIFFDTW
jgi:hypothetical protein